MKRFLSLIALVLMTTTLVACTGQQDDTATEDTEEVPAAEVVEPAMEEEAEVMEEAEATEEDGEAMEEAEATEEDATVTE